MSSKYYSFLISLSCISFGGHFVHSSLSMFGLYFINDGLVSPAGLGILMAACSLPSMFLPLLVGYLIDTTRKENSATLVLFFFTIAGLLIFSVAICYEMFAVEVVALLLYGSGASSITVVQRILITLYLKGNETFTTGFYIALANFAKLLGKVSIGPATAFLHSYKKALLLPILACMLSLLSYLTFTVRYGEDNESNRNKLFDYETTGTSEELVSSVLHDSTYQNDTINKNIKNTTSDKDEDITSSVQLVTLSTGLPYDSMVNKPKRSKSIDISHNNLSSNAARRYSGDNAQPNDITKMENGTTVLGITAYKAEAGDLNSNNNNKVVTNWEMFIKPIAGLPEKFYWLAVVHTLYIMIFHSLMNFLPHYAYGHWGENAVNAGYMASIPNIMIMIVAPCMGLVVDRVGHRTLICAIAAATTVVAYVILVFAEDVHPYWKMIFVSISQAFLPALTLSEVSRILPDHSVGVAFGVIEVLDSFVNVFGNIIFGVLYNSTGSYFMGMCLLLALSVAGFIVLAYLSILEMRLERFNSTASQRMYYEITSSSNETKEHRYESI